MNKLISFFKAITQLLRIAILGLLLVVSTIEVHGYYVPVLGIILLWYAGKAFMGKSKGLRVWYNIDVMMATILYGTLDRTISGITGDNLKLGKPHWKLIGYVIDTLAKLCGDKPNHCIRASNSEKNKK